MGDEGDYFPYSHRRSMSFSPVMTLSHINLVNKHQALLCSRHCVKREFKTGKTWYGSQLYGLGGSAMETDTFTNHSKELERYDGNVARVHKGASGHGRCVSERPFFFFFFFEKMTFDILQGFAET